MKVYKSKFGYEIMGFLILFFLVTIGFKLYKNESLNTILIVGGINLLILGFFLYLNFSTEYRITDNGLLNIKCGFAYNKSFDINKIKSIGKSNNWISSPAPSLDRIELIYDKFDQIIISPKDKTGFSMELTKINPNILNKLIS